MLSTRVLNGSFIGLKHGVDDGVEVLLGHNRTRLFLAYRLKDGGKLEEAAHRRYRLRMAVRMLAQNISSTSRHSTHCSDKQETLTKAHANLSQF